MQAVENCPTQPSAQRRSTAAVLPAAAARSAAGWAAPNRDTSKTIDVHLGWLRRKLGDDARGHRRPPGTLRLRARAIRGWTWPRGNVLNLERLDGSSAAEGSGPGKGGMIMATEPTPSGA